MITSATYVQRKTYQIDEIRLRKALTAKVYDKFTVRKLDRSALEKAMEAEQVDSKIVAQCATPVVGKPYLKLTTKEVQDD